MRKFCDKNPLGDVLVAVSDWKEGEEGAAVDGRAEYYESEVVSAGDYYPFGYQMPDTSRSLTSSDRYRFGFNGKEKDESGELGSLTHYDYGFRIYNPSIARFLSVDPLTKSFAMLTPYQFASNKPIYAIDLDGLESKVSIVNEETGEVFLEKEVAPNSFGLGDCGNLSVCLSRENFERYRGETNDYIFGNHTHHDYIVWDLVYNYYFEGELIDSETHRDGEFRDIQSGETSTQVAAELVLGEAILKAIFKGFRLIKNGKGLVGSALKKAASKLDEPIQRIKNKFPDDPIPADGRSIGNVTKNSDGLVEVNGKLANINQWADFVVDLEGNLKIGRKHQFLSDNLEVQAAGRIKIRKGKIVGINNASGHYTPTIEEADNFIEIFERLGYNIRGTTFETFIENKLRLLEKVKSVKVE